LKINHFRHGVHRADNKRKQRDKRGYIARASGKKGVESRVSGIHNVLNPLAVAINGDLVSCQVKRKRDIHSLAF
jgi:hypothetical protein